MAKNNKKDDDFINYVKAYIFNNNLIRFTIIGFFITINLAIFAGLYNLYKYWDSLNNVIIAIIC